jgi:signal transduction histidine kinase
MPAIEVRESSAARPSAGPAGVRPCGLLDAWPEAAAIVAADGAIVRVNAAFQRLVGYGPADLPAEAAAQLGSTNGGDWLCPRRGAEPLRLRRETVEFTTPEGVVQRLVVLRDRSRERALLGELHAALEAKNEFAARVSHEFRTPLTAIQEGLDLVLDGLGGPLTPVQQDFLQLARRNVTRLHRLVADTLDYADYLRDDEAASREPVELVEFARGVAASRTGVSFEATDRAQAALVRIDARRVAQALDRLLDNAFRHGGGAGVRLTADRDGNEARIRILDSGPGVPEAQRERIFEPFVQLSTGPGRKVGGIGLGLTLARALVEQSGGRLAALPTIGPGACFEIALPSDPPP